MSAMYTPAAPYATYSGNGVDGSRGTAFVTNPKSALQWWEVDLGSEYSLDWLVIYRYLANININVRVLVSVDGEKYSQVTELHNKAHTLFTRVPLGGTTGRYIRLLSLDNNLPLAISEVLAFGTRQEERQN